MRRHGLTPSSALPLVYFGWAHVGLGLAFLALVVEPSLPGGYFLHPRMVALVHLVTIAWISGSILGAFYIVGPLALGMPLPVGRGDWLACTAFLAGTAGMVCHFWFGLYGIAAWSGLLVLSAVLWLAVRAVVGIRTSTAPWPVLLHVVLAFSNMIAAGVFGVVVGLDRAYALFGLPPVAATLAHAHVATIGWPLMMVVGLAYRLVPMFIPAKMPVGTHLAASAILLEAGVAIIGVALLIGSRWLPVGALLVVGGFAVFVGNMRAAVKQRLPRPPALPTRDWSTWQTHVALVWLLVAVALGAALSVMRAGQVGLAWIYGVAAIIGFVSQIVVGIQGRLVPLYAYYRAMVLGGGLPPSRAANELPTPRFARPIFLLWTVGVPWLAVGLASSHEVSIRLSSLLLLGGVVVGAAYLAYLMRVART